MKIHDLSPYITLVVFFSFATITGLLAYSAAIRSTRRLVKTLFDEQLDRMALSKEQLIKEIREEIAVATGKD